MQELQFFFNGLKKISVIWKFPCANSILLENFLLVQAIVDRDSGKIISLKILIAHNVDTDIQKMVYNFSKWQHHPILAKFAKNVPFIKGTLFKTKGPGPVWPRGGPAPHPCRAKKGILRSGWL